MINKLAKFKVKREKLPECVEAIKQFVHEVKQQEPDVLYYESFQEADGVSFTHIMSFKDEAAGKFHHKTPHMNKFVNILYPNCDEKPVYTEVIQIE